MSVQTFEETNARSAAALQLANPATVRAIQSHLRDVGERGRVRFSASTQLVGGYETAIDIRSFHQTIDEPPSLGGSDRGPNPVEVVLAALGACQEIVYATYAVLLGVTIQHLDIQVAGDLDPRGFFGVADQPAGFDRIVYEVNLASPNPPEQVRELVQTVNQRCPVLDILQRPVPVESRVALNGNRLA